MSDAIRGVPTDGERSVLLGLADFGLPDAFRAVHGYDREAWSHQCVRNGEVKWRRRFDHVFNLSVAETQDSALSSLAG